MPNPRPDLDGAGDAYLGPHRCWNCGAVLAAQAVHNGRTCLFVTTHEGILMRVYRADLNCSQCGRGRHFISVPVLPALVKGARLRAN